MIALAPKVTEVAASIAVPEIQGESVIAATDRWRAPRFSHDFRSPDAFALLRSVTQTKRIKVPPLGGANERTLFQRHAFRTPW